MSYYSVHKIMAGLLDTHEQTQNAQAWSVLLKMAAFFKGRIDRLVAAKGMAWWEQGSVTLSFCTAINLLHTGFNEVIGACQDLQNDNASKPQVGGLPARGVRRHERGRLQPLRHHRRRRAQVRTAPYICRPRSWANPSLS